MLKQAANRRQHSGARFCLDNRDPAKWKRYSCNPDKLMKSKSGNGFVSSIAATSSDRYGKKQGVSPPARAPSIASRNCSTKPKSCILIDADWLHACFLYLFRNQWPESMSGRVINAIKILVRDIRCNPQQNKGSRMVFSTNRSDDKHENRIVLRPNHLLHRNGGRKFAP